MSLKRFDVRLTYTIENTQPLHVGMGHGVGGVHRALLLDQKHRPYIPGSTLKGRLRYSVAQLCSWFGLDSQRNGVEDDGDRMVNSGPEAARDLPSRLFGTAWSPGTLRFGDARLIVDEPSGSCVPDWREARTCASRSRVLGTTAERRLYQIEVAAPGLVFQGRIDGYILASEPEITTVPYEVYLLWLAVHSMVESGLGGNKSSGNGAFTLYGDEPVQLSVDGTRINATEVSTESTGVLDLLSDLELGARGAGTP